MNRIDRLFHFVETRKPSDRVILKTLLFLATTALIYLGITFGMQATIEVPEHGGTLTEGIVGTPRFINPLLAVTGADRDMTALIYSSLMRPGKDGVLVPDLLESLTISDDKLIYNVVLRQDVVFHDGTPLTSDDVIFTVLKAQDPMLKSPLRPNWEGITVERLGDHELNFVLPQAYTPFIENLTLGILPRHIWESANTESFPFSETNTMPVGSGPYKVGEVGRTKSGIPESYTLTPFAEYYKKVPRIESLVFRFFPNETTLVEALKEGGIDGAASLGASALTSLMDDSEFKEQHVLYTTYLPRTFALFFNQNEQPLFRDPAVRKALNVALDRTAIVEEILKGYGAPIDGPLPPGFTKNETYKATSTGSLVRLDAAREILRAGGWRTNETTGRWEKKEGTTVTELAFSIETGNSDLFAQTADILKATWANLGIPVDVKKFEQSDLTQTIIRPRKYNALLFGTAVGRELDFYSFWHSSQRNDPGLNVALYANITTDALLSDARTTLEPEEREDAYARFGDEIRAELPALFLFVPKFTYLLPKTVADVNLSGIAGPYERFSQIEDWYIHTESIWPLFTRFTQS